MAQFRHQALQAQRRPADIFGEVVLHSPLHHRVFGIGGAAVALALLLSLVFGQYGQRITVAGQLLPAQGLVRIAAPLSGTLLASHVSNGQQVAAGDVLFTLADARYTANGSETVASLRQAIEARRGALQTEIAASKAIRGQDAASLRSRIAGLEERGQILQRQLQLARARLVLSEQAAARFEQLSGSGFASPEQRRVKKQEELDDAMAVAALQKQGQEVADELAGARRQLAALPWQHDKEQATLARSYQEIEEQLVATESQRRATVVAPMAGTVTGIIGAAGNLLTPGQAIATLVPQDATLQANLYVPSQGIGLLKPGAAVYLRYRAFPHQKFGLAKGTVLDISASPLRADELDNRMRLAELTSASSGEPVYRVRVALASQTVQAQGHAIRLLPGTLLDADITLDRKPLYRWILDPLDKLAARANS
ncbi:HlyD family secretion protein [Pseudoduganella sp. HUAS MS19]